MGDFAVVAEIKKVISTCILKNENSCFEKKACVEVIVVRLERGVSECGYGVYVRCVFLCFLLYVLYVLPLRSWRDVYMRLTRRVRVSRRGRWGIAVRVLLLVEEGDEGVADRDFAGGE